MKKSDEHEHFDLGKISGLDFGCLEGLFQSIHNGVTITDADGRIIYVNPAFTQITGYSREEAIGDTPSILHSGKHDQQFYEGLWKALLTKGFWQGEIWNRCKEGEIFPEILTINKIESSKSETPFYLGVSSDISFLHEDQLKRHNLALYDPLTLLPNRQLLADRFQQVQSNLERVLHDESTDKAIQTAVLFADLNKFKLVNDSYGHITGDMLLQYVGRVLKKYARKIDTIARYGGDEFVILLPSIANNQQVIDFCDRIREALTTRINIKGFDLTTELSFGVCFFPGEATTLETVIERADKAMYHAKKNKLGITFYHDLTDGPTRART